VPEAKQDPLLTVEPQRYERFQPQATSGGLVDINTAGQGELESLPGIGPVLAQAIIEYRREHGSFTDIAEIQDVPGIGAVKFQQIMGLITVAGAPLD
jgi:competence protein ComEA